MTATQSVPPWRPAITNDPLREAHSSGAPADDHVRCLADPATVDTPSPTTTGAYYSLVTDDRFWILAFDIDAKDVAKQRIAETLSTETTQASTDQLAAAGVPTTPPTATDPDQTYQYTWADLDQAISLAFRLAEFLADDCEFEHTRIFYSGQGTHVYALDQDPSHRYTKQPRTVLTEYITHKLSIPIDSRVTSDDARVLRIPRSLHTGVSRLVTEISSPDFDPRTDSRALPAFLSDSSP